MEKLKDSSKYYDVYDLLKIVKESYEPDKERFLFKDTIATWYKMHVTKNKKAISVSVNIRDTLLNNFGNLRILVEKATFLVNKRKLKKRFLKQVKRKYEAFSKTIQKIWFDKSFFEVFGKKEAEDIVNQLVKFIKFLMGKVS